MSTTAIYFLVGINLGLIFVMLAAPLGTRTFAVSRVVRASRRDVWSALWPLGDHAGWSGEIINVLPAGADGDQAWLELSHEGRDGRPIRRLVALDNVIPETRYSMRIVDDSSLDHSFWANYRAEVGIADAEGGVAVTFCRTDRYRGLAFMVFRYFAARRELARLDEWVRTGVCRKGGVFEHPATQMGFAAVSTLLVWPLFGLTLQGLLFAATLTGVVALHELGHMAAFRLMGHKSARMIFIPLLGGIAIGGRPYDSRFEVAFSALMGAGFSALFVPLAIVGSGLAASAGMHHISTSLVIFAVFLGLFNLANLVPVWKFDGGQVLRQICPGQLSLATSSFLLLAAFLALGHAIGLPAVLLMGAGTVVAILSLMTAGSAVKPRHDLKPILGFERVMLAGGLLAVFAIHANSVFWAATTLSAAAG
ncbi:MAG: site-2 protease family protein [Rhizobiaceae bacterium]